MPEIAPPALAEIHTPGVDLVVVQRPATFAAALATLPLAPSRVDEVIRRGAEAVTASAACHALALALPGLAEDIAACAADFLEAMTLDAARFRLEIALETSCPKFHIDFVQVRLITTYLGRGTEYVETAAPDTVRHVPTGSVALFKGRTHPTHAGVILHRSPETTAATPRLVLILDY